MRLAYLGNFTADHSTEQQLARAFRRQGHTVLPVDVRHASARRRQVLDALRRERPDVLIYTRSNGCPLGPLWTDVWRALREAGILIVGFHLDVFRGIPTRERFVEAPYAYRDPQFTVDRLYTADGSPETTAWYEAHDLPHQHVRPGVDPDLVAWDGLPFPGTPPVVFVGSVSDYHDEHPWRRELVARLRAQYGNRFAVFGPDTLTVRGVKLTRLIRSTQVVVGDCFGSGRRPAYWSDRVPETLGRGGRLVHPAVDGLGPLPGLHPHSPEDIDEIVRTVDALLGLPAERAEADWIAAKSLAVDSWDVRAAELAAEFARQKATA